MYNTKRTGPQIPFAILGGTVTLKDYNENGKQLIKFAKGDLLNYLHKLYQLKLVLNR